MILTINKNTPVTAPQFNDMDAALALYRTFRNDQLLTMSNFFKFITIASADRDEFLKIFKPTVIVRNNIYVKVNYN